MKKLIVKFFNFEEFESNIIVVIVKKLDKKGF